MKSLFWAVKFSVSKQNCCWRGGGGGGVFLFRERCPMAVLPVSHFLLNEPRCFLSQKIAALFRKTLRRLCCFLKAGRHKLSDVKEDQWIFYWIKTGDFRG